MRVRRYIIASTILFVIALVWNGFVHLVLLRSLDARVEHLRRPDFADRMWLSLVLTAALVCLFVWGYQRVARSGTVREGLMYGLFFALLAGLLVDANQYLLYPIPALVAAGWFAGGVVEFAIYGVVVSRLFPPAVAR